MAKRNSALRYAGLATQFFIVIGISLYGGLLIDRKISPNTPLLVWILPLVFIVFSIYKIVKDTNPNNKKL